MTEGHELRRRFGKRRCMRKKKPEAGREIKHSTTQREREGESFFFFFFTFFSLFFSSFFSFFFFKIGFGNRDRYMEAVRRG